MSIGVSPDTVHIEGGKGSFVVINPNPYPVWYTAEAQGMRIMPASDVIKAHEKKEVHVSTPFFFVKEEITIHLNAQSNAILLPAARIQAVISSAEKVKKGSIVFFLIVLLGSGIYGIGFIVFGR